MGLNSDADAMIMGMDHYDDGLLDNSHCLANGNNEDNEGDISDNE